VGGRAVGAEIGLAGEADGWGHGNSVGRRRFKFDSNYNSNGFKQIQTVPNFNRRKRDLPKLKIFEVKYYCE
jgi:hypothetical protein